MINNINRSGKIKNYKSMQETKRDWFHQRADFVYCSGKIKSYSGFIWRFA